jgi:hemolysin activation/secretion protein
LRGSVRLEKIRVEGVTVFKPSRVDEILAKYPRPSDFDSISLEAIRLDLTKLYVDAGYISSGALIDGAQDVADGELVITVVEGTLGTITVEGHGELSREYVERRARLGAGPPFNMAEFGQQLQIMLQNPVIGKVNAEVMPGSHLGEADVVLRLDRPRAYEAYLTAANDRSPSIGEIHSELTVIARNLTGVGDMLAVSATSSDGMLGGSVEASIPVAADDTRITASAQINDTIVIEEPFNDIDIEGRSQDYDVGLVWPAYRTPFKELDVGISLAHRESRTTLLGQPFSFSPGVINGEAEVTVARFSQSWTHRFAEGVGIFAARSVESMGLDVWNEIDPANCPCPPQPPPPAGPDGQFLSWLLQLQLAYRFQSGLETGDLRSMMLVRFDGQLAGDGLLPMEKISLGGPGTVRGFRANTLVRDSGLSASAEVRVPVFRYQVLDPGDDPAAGAFEVALFGDYGYAANHGAVGLNQSELNEIYSTGIGLRWEPVRNLKVQVSYAYDLQNLADPASPSLVDRGIDFRMTLDLGRLAEDAFD